MTKKNIEEKARIDDVLSNENDNKEDIEEVIKPTKNNYTKFFRGSFIPPSLNFVKFILENIINLYKLCKIFIIL